MISKEQGKLRKLRRNLVEVIDLILDPTVNKVLSRFHYREYIRKARTHPDSTMTRRLQYQAVLSCAVKNKYFPER